MDPLTDTTLGLNALWVIVACALAGMISILKAKNVWHVILAGFFVGCATSFKLNGLVFVAAATGVCLFSRPLRKYTPVLLATAVFVILPTAV